MWIWKTLDAWIVSQPDLICNLHGSSFRSSSSLPFVAYWGPTIPFCGIWFHFQLIRPIRPWIEEFESRPPHSFVIPSPFGRTSHNKFSPSLKGDCLATYEKILRICDEIESSSWRNTRAKILNVDLGYFRRRWGATHHQWIGNNEIYKGVQSNW